MNKRFLKGVKIINIENKINLEDKNQFNDLILNLTKACQEFKYNEIPSDLLILTINLITTYAIVFQYSFEELELFNNIFNLLSILIYIKNIPSDLLEEIITVYDKMEEAKELIFNFNRAIENQEKQDKMPIMSSIFALSGILEESGFNDEYKYI